MKKSTLLIIAAATLLASCGDTSEGELIKDNTREGVTTLLSFSQDKADKRVAMVGYLSFGGGTYEVGKNEIRMELMSAPDGADGGELLNSFPVKMGDGKNEVSFPKGSNSKSAGYRTTSSEIDVAKITVTTADGKNYPLTQKLKVSGTVKYTKDFSTGKTMETPMFNSDKKGFVYELQDVRFDAAQ